MLVAVGSVGKGQLCCDTQAWVLSLCWKGVQCCCPPMGSLPARASDQRDQPDPPHTLSWVPWDTKVPETGQTTQPNPRWGWTSLDSLFGPPIPSPPRSAWGHTGGPWSPSHLSHVDLSPLLEDGRAGDIEPLLKTLQFQLVHLLIARLHLDGVEGQVGKLLHVLGIKPSSAGQDSLSARSGLGCATPHRLHPHVFSQPGVPQCCPH